MLKAERQHRIVETVTQKKVVTVDELAGNLGVSVATIRRDLEELDRKGELERTHGGAMCCSDLYDEASQEVPIGIRAQISRREKERIAQVAVGLLQEGDTVFVGPGSTTRLLAAQLGTFRRLTILTNDIDVAKEVSHTDNLLVVTGGKLKKNSCTLHGFFTEEMLQGVKVDLAFMSADAVDATDGFMDLGVDEITIKRMAMQNAKKCVMLCDASKFTASAFVHICNIQDVDVVVTNDELNGAIKEQLADIDVTVIYAP